MGGTVSSSRIKKVLFRAKKVLCDPPNQHLCVCCQQIFLLWGDVHNGSEYILKYYSHHEDQFAFARSIQNGCYLCSLFMNYDVEVLKRFMDSVAKETKEKSCRCTGLHVLVTKSFLPIKRGDNAQDYVLSSHWNLRLLCGFINNSNSTWDHLLLSVEVIRDDDHIIGDTAITPASKDQPDGSTNDLISISKSPDPIHTVQPLAYLREWFEECCNSHNECRTSSAQVTPTRLISLASGIPRLCTSTQFTICPKYATLSHCWGSAKFTTLNRTNLEAFQKEIPPSALQRTFKDAMAICEYIGIIYIWIDSLCILQGDEEDWNREAPLMCDVYGGSSLNIAASGASDGSKGCFFDRDGRLPAGFKVEAMVDKKWHPYFCVLTDLYPERLGKMPLMKRSWVVQERILSPRTVHFTTTELFWECNGLVACETFPKGYPVPLRYGKSFWTKQPVTRLMWPWIINQYSQTELTYQKDKLAAISGIAQHIQLETGDTYTFGLWSRDLEDQLCWHTSRNKLERNGRAPSWSWASVDGLIDWDDLEAGDIHVKALQLQNTPLGRRSRPDALSGKLVLSSRFLSSTTIPKSHRNGAETSIGTPCGYLNRLTASELLLDLDCPSASDYDSDYQIYFLPCRSQIEDKEEHESQLPRVMLKGLLLERSSQSKSAFQRIGVFQWLSLIHPMRPTTDQAFELFEMSLHDQGYQPKVIYHDKLWNHKTDKSDSSRLQQFAVELV